MYTLRHCNSTHTLVSYPERFLHVPTAEIIVSISVEAEINEEFSEGFSISVSPYSILHATREVLVVDHYACNMEHILS